MLVLVGEFVTIILGRGGLRGSSMVPFERSMVVSCRQSSVTVALSVTIRPQFAMSPTLKSIGTGHFGSKFGEEGFADVRQILTQSGSDMAMLSYAKEIVSIFLLFGHNARM